MAMQIGPNSKWTLILSNSQTKMVDAKPEPFAMSQKAGIGLGRLSVATAQQN